MADMTFTDEASARAAVEAAFAQSTKAMGEAINMEDRVLAAMLRNYVMAKHGFDCVWRITEEWPLFWAEIERPVDHDNEDIQWWAMDRDPNGSDQFAMTYEEGDKTAQVALLTQDKETAALFKLFFG